MSGLFYDSRTRDRERARTDMTGYAQRKRIGKTERNVGKQTFKLFDENFCLLIIRRMRHGDRHFPVFREVPESRLQILLNGVFHRFFRFCQASCQSEFI